MAQSLKMKQPYVRGASYFRGTVIINNNAASFNAAGDRSHVGSIYDYENRFIHCHNSGQRTGVTIDDNAEVSNKRWLQYWGGWTGYETTGLLDRLGVDFSCERIDDHAKKNDGLIAKRHAIWWCHPYLLAVYFSHVCRQYGLPERMAVMCSMREIGPSAWQPGKLRWDQVRGWSERVDHNSLGPFQQQSPLLSGSDKWYWGRPEQVEDIRYSVHRFCKEAVKLKRKVSNDDKDGLTKWIADVQKPRQDLRGAYAEFFGPAQTFIDLGYSMIPNEHRPEHKRTRAGVLFGDDNVGKKPHRGGPDQPRQDQENGGRPGKQHDGKFSEEELAEIGRDFVQLMSSMRGYALHGGPSRSKSGNGNDEEDD